MKIYSPILSTIEKSVQDGLLAAGREVLEESNRRAPKDTGAMVKTGRVDVDDLTVQVSYRGKVAPIQHENLDYQHDDGEPKFLENAAMQLDVEQVIGQAVRRALNG